MNRCSTMTLFSNYWLRPVVGALIAASIGAVSLSSQAQIFEPIPRNFPDSAQRAILTVTQTPEILINNAPDRLAPGARIHDTANRLVMSASLTGQNILVNFVREPVGLVSEVWILTPLEAAQPLPAQP